MAITKIKRSVHPAQLRGRSPITKSTTHELTKSGRAASRPPSSSLDRFARFPHSKFFYFRPAQGKTIEKVEFSASVDHHDITIWFTNKTSLNFSIEAGFTLKPEYSDWKSGEQRILRAWRPILCRI